MPARHWPRILFYAVVLLALLLDQATKIWALSSLLPRGSVSVLPGFLDLTFVHNTGVAFGMFSGQRWLVVLLMVALAAAAFYYARGLNWRGWEPNVIGGFLVGGAFGNLLDRFRLGYVVDFLDVHLRQYHWPVFNVADSLICIAVGWIVIGQLRTGATK